MKPKNLKYPMTFDQRQVMIHDGVLYIPRYTLDFSTFTFPGWAAAEVFGNTNPVVIEYCSGNGDWVLSKAQANLDKNFVAVEKRFDRVRKTFSKRYNRGVKNLFIVCGAAQAVTKHYFPQGSVEAIYVNFPDPWPKLRHAKHRLMQDPFVTEMRALLKPEGTFTLATDDITYSEGAMQVLDAHAGFSNTFPNPGFVSEYAGYGDSYFENLWRSKGMSIRYHCYSAR